MSRSDPTRRRPASRRRPAQRLGWSGRGRSEESRAAHHRRATRQTKTATAARAGWQAAVRRAADRRSRVRSLRRFRSHGRRRGDGRGGGDTSRGTAVCLARLSASSKRASPSQCCMTLLKRKPAWRSVVVMSLSSGAGKVSTTASLPSRAAGPRVRRHDRRARSTWRSVPCRRHRHAPQQRAIERVAVEIEQADFVDQATGFDQPACACLAAGVLEFGLLLSEPGFLLFMRAQTLGQRTGMVFPYSEKMQHRDDYAAQRLFPGVYSVGLIHPRTIGGGTCNASLV
jgi:hypothetical protein